MVYRLYDTTSTVTIILYQVHGFGCYTPAPIYMHFLDSSCRTGAKQRQPIQVNGSNSCMSPDMIDTLGTEIQHMTNGITLSYEWHVRIAKLSSCFTYIIHAYFSVQCMVHSNKTYPVVGLAVYRAAGNKPPKLADRQLLK